MDGSKRRLRPKLPEELISDEERARARSFDGFLFQCACRMVPNDNSHSTSLRE